MLKDTVLKNCITIVTIKLNHSRLHKHSYIAAVYNVLECTYTHHKGLPSNPNCFERGATEDGNRDCTQPWIGVHQ